MKKVSTSILLLTVVLIGFALYALYETYFSKVKFSSGYTIEVDLDPIITDYSIEQNSQNPLSLSIKIKYEIPKNSFVNVTVYDSDGREIKSLINQRESAGYHEVKFEQSDLLPGIYSYRIQAGEFSKIQKMTLRSNIDG